MPTVTHRSPGFILCAKTVRPRFAGPEAVGSAAAGIAGATVQRFSPIGGAVGDELARWGHGEGPRSFVVVSPGSVTFTRADLNRRHLGYERELSRHGKIVSEAVGPLLFDPALSVLAGAGLCDPPAPAGGRPAAGRVITSWSRKSRSNMVRRLVSLDYGPMVQSGDLAMVTLTYPGDWLTVAPDAAACLAHVTAFQKRWARRWGSRPLGVWKREYQRRGAPHYHLLVAPPGGRTRAREFRSWLSATWADVVAHPDPVERMRHESAGTGVDWNDGLRMTDPKRIAVYFTKHGLLAGKEYQNVAPAEWVEGGGGVGRFWGVWGLRPAEVAVMVSGAEMTAGLRTLRRWNDSASPVRVALVWRVNRATGVVRVRKVRRRIRRLRSPAGYLSVNDGPSAAFMVQRVIESMSIAAPVCDRAQRLAVLRARYRPAFTGCG